MENRNILDRERSPCRSLSMSVLQIHLVSSSACVNSTWAMPARLESTECRLERRMFALRGSTCISPRGWRARSMVRLHHGLLSATNCYANWLNRKSRVAARRRVVVCAVLARRPAHRHRNGTRRPGGSRGRAFTNSRLLGSSVRLLRSLRYRIICFSNLEWRNSRFRGSANCRRRWSRLSQSGETLPGMSSGDSAHVTIGDPGRFLFSSKVISEPQGARNTHRAVALRKPDKNTIDLGNSN